jgi:hypothetical protein
MRRGLLILALGLVGAALAYSCFYLMGTATPRGLMRSPQPELAWLKHEFKLGDAEFKRVSDLHASYLPQCKERCLRIGELNGQLSQALGAATEVTPQVEKLLNQRAQMRATCQAEMLQHFFEVSRTMPPAQGQRYLAWVQQNTGLREQAMNHGEGRHGKPAGPAHHR